MSNASSPIEGAHPNTAPGVRPSPGAAATERVGALECSAAALAPDVAAPGDGRTPVQPSAVGAVSVCAPVEASLHIACLEDDLRDRELVAAALQDAGLACHFTYAASQPELEAVLRQPQLDIILSDFTLPSFGGAEALRLARRLRPEVPFIYVSGTIGEERAVESLHLGAVDYVLKDRLARLGPVVQRALHEARLRQAQQKAELERINAQAAEREARAFMEAAQEVAHLGSWSSGPLSQGPLVWSSEVYRIFGLTEAEFTGTVEGFFARIHPEDREGVKQARQAALEHGGAYELDHRIVRPDGTVRWVHERAKITRDAQGQPLRMLGVVQDITERKGLEEVLRQAQKMDAIGQLAGGVAHDFNNLLAIVQGNADLALMDSESMPARVCDSLKQIITATERAARLTRQLLAFSRRQVMQARPLDLDEVIANLSKMLTRIIGENIHLQRTPSARPAFVHGDAGMLEQALVNLVVNARDAMPHGGTLWLTLDTLALDAAYVRAHPEARAGEYVRLTVRDSGTGIAPEHLSRIFEPFFTTKQPGKGTGLGLAMVYGIVKQHHGWIEVASQPGAGSTFSLFLPAIPPPAQPAAAPQTEAAPPAGTETILLVEDDFAVRTLTQRLLETSGYRVWKAASGQEALQIWRAQAPQIDLLLTDLIMPDSITGRELAAQLQAQEPALKIIFMSGYSSEIAGGNAECLKPLNDRFLQKPCSSRTILEAVRHSLDGP